MQERDILQCIETVLDLTGPTIKNEIFWRMAILHNSGKGQLLTDPQILNQVIRETFGKKADEIESSIVAEIGKKFNFSANSQPSLVDAIKDAKRQVADFEAQRP